FRPAMPALLLDELSNAQVEEVGGHFRRFLESESLLLPLRRFGFDGHVRDDGEVGVGSDSNFEHCLVSRMVHAWQNLASLNCFEGNIPHGFEIHYYFAAVFETGKINIEE